MTTVDNPSKPCVDGSQPVVAWSAHSETGPAPSELFDLCGLGLRRLEGTRTPNLLIRRLGEVIQRRGAGSPMRDQLGSGVRPRAVTAAAVAVRDCCQLLRKDVRPPLPPPRRRGCAASKGSPYSSPTRPGRAGSRALRGKEKQY